VIFVPQPVAHPTAPRTNGFAFTPAENGKSRMTFILLGVLLGAFGAHNFYAGFRKKAVAQLLITVLTLGFASPMSWMWAVIDVCTITEDSAGVKFNS
jgi:TM2 domain-containing membrane protein YozV